MESSSHSISVVIPAFREGPVLLKLLSSLSVRDDIEVIVSIPRGDSVSAGATKKFKVTLVEGDAGRGAQLHAGAMAASGDTLVFCHADTILPDGWNRPVCDALWKQGAVGGAFRLRIDTPKLPGRLISFGARLRANALGLVYGDQAIFTTAEQYRSVGGFRPFPVMEDIDFVKRLRRIGRFALLGDEVATSPRRWEDEGYAYCTARNAVLMALYLLGAPPATLAYWYRRRPALR